jgi:choice-of-anchor A domain-containing protein
MELNIMRMLNTVAFVASALAASSSFAAPLTASDILSQFNAVVTGKFTSSSDVEGRLVANEMTGGATFYNKPDSSTSAYAAVNAITVDAGVNGNVNNSGNVNVVGANNGHFSYNGGKAVSTPSFAISDFSTPLDALASQLAGLKTTAGTSISDSDPNSFTFNETGTGTNVFNLTATELEKSRNLSFSGSASTIIINVTGNYTDMTNFNASTFLNTHVIWNFVDATSLSFQGWHGTVLAGDASVTNSSAMEGTLYAANFTGNGELHNYAFAGALPVTAVPEPSTWAMLGLGLLGVVVAARKRGKSA